MAQGSPERPGWQVRISPAVPGPDDVLMEADIPSGGGVWVGGRWVLTCAHVVGAEPQPVMVRFSFADGEPVPATVGPQGWLAEQHGDLALLELDSDPPPAARPAPLRPARAVTGHSCAAYGYPRGLDGGVWSEPEITGQTVDRLQLTAQVMQGHQIERGFSGTGLVDTQTGAVVGLVVTRDRGPNVLGGFAIPLQAAVAAFPQLGPWVGWRLGTDRFLRQHWRPRARGVYQDTTPGWYFTGRAALLRELTGWLEDGSPGRVARVVTGPAGAGKSAVLAWLCALSDPQLRAEINSARPAVLADAAAVPAAGRVSAAVWAHDLDARGAAAALAAALALPVAADAAVEDVLAAVGDLDPAERDSLVVVLDALDEARAPRDIARQVLVPLAGDLGVKVLAGSRPGRDEELLTAFGQPEVYRLDDPAWFDRQDLADYAAAWLRADFDPDRPSGYRADPEACEQVVAAIAEAAGSNFLVAGLAARARAGEPVIDVSTRGWRSRQRFPAEVGQAFDDYVDRFGAKARTRARDLLRAAAYAERSGLPADELWVGMASALAAPRRYGTDDLAWLLDSAAGYLVESGGEEGQPAYRIFHQALIEHLRPPGDEQQAQRQIVSTLIAAVPQIADGPDWAHAPAYIRGHLPAHAAAADRLDELLEDARYLIAVDPPRLGPYLDAARSAPARATAMVYRQAAHLFPPFSPAARASELELCARYLGHDGLAALVSAAAPGRPWHTHWSQGRAGRGHQILNGHVGWVNAVATGALPDGTAVIVSGGTDRTVRVWRLADGAPVGEPLTGRDQVTAVATGALADGTPVIISGGHAGFPGGYDGTVRVWRLADGVPVGEPLTGHDGPVNAVATGALPDGTQIIVSGGTDSTVRVWRLADGAPVGEPLTGHDDRVNAVATGALPDGTQVIVSGGWDGTVRIWRLADGAPVGKPLTGHDDRVNAVATGALPDGTQVIVSGGTDGTVRVWRLADGAPVGKPLTGHDGWVNAVATSVLPDGTTVIVSGGDDETVRVWRLADGAPVGEPLTSHLGRQFRARVMAVATAALQDGTPVLVSGGMDAMVRVWRLADSTPVGEPLTGHDTLVTAVATGVLPDGTPVVVSGSDDETVGVCRLADGAPVGGPLAGHDGPVTAVATGVLLDGTPVVISGGRDGTVRVWRLADGTPHGEPLAGHDGPVTAVATGVLPDGTPVVISGGRDGTVRVWRLADGTPVGEPLTGHDGWLSSVATATLPDGTSLIVGIISPNDGHYVKVRIWRLADGTPIAEPLRHHDGRVRALATGALPDGTPVVVSGGEDGTVLVWRLADGALVGGPLTGNEDSVTAAATGALRDGTPVVIIGSGYNGALRVWRLADGAPLEPPLSLLASIRDIAAQGGHVVTATGNSITAHSPIALMAASSDLRGRRGP